ncbi:hypothetical protein [Sphingomonas sp. PAMC 26621]|uniref:hypothetical protein n=1 Tax=Sphingomonas sp. PAMC 26621 TaxID=1112213 RepID=UPI000288C979|nr:hypothetical protein [Sphingomonas sp. PAMC 26621]
MTAVRSDIFLDILARLTAIGDTAETELMPSSDPVEFPARHIFDNGQSIVELEAGITRYQIDFTVEGYLEQPGGQAAYLALNNFYAATVAALVTDPPLGGLVETLDEGDMRITVAPLADKPRLGFAIDFSLTYATRRDDPAQPA